MPVTPFHFGPGAALHAIFPSRVSFLAFCTANVLIDLESGYNLFMGNDRVHAHLHTYIGATLVVGAVMALHFLLRSAGERFQMPNLFDWRALTRSQVLLGTALGGYSHILLDSVTHADMAPLFPVSDRNGLLRYVSWDALHIVCTSLGLVAVGILVVRYLAARSR
jgi:hypothetical protein